MTTYDLMIKVKNELEAKGFTTSSAKFRNALDYEVQAHAEKDGKCEWKMSKKYHMNQFFGLRITFEVVHRHNGTSENQSVDISIYEWENSSGKRILKERINTKMGEKAIMTRINSVVATYERL